MSAEQVIRIAARPLLPRLVASIEERDLHQVGRIALWQKGEGQPRGMQIRIAQQAMIDEIRRNRWTGRSGRGTGGESMWMPSVDEFDGLPEMMTDDEAASMLAVRQLLANLDRLTDRQRDVLGALASGLEQTEVARELGMSDARVSQHVKALREFAARYLECSAS